MCSARREVGKQINMRNVFDFVAVRATGRRPGGFKCAVCGGVIVVVVLVGCALADTDMVAN